MSCEIIKLSEQTPPLVDKWATWCNTHSRRESECLKFDICLAVVAKNEMKAKLDAALLQIDELKLAVKESNADADALILLSKGLYERIQGKPDWVVASSCQTALNYIDHMNRLNGEMLELLRQADDLYTGYGLICGPIKDFPKYEGTVHQGEWINKVRKIVRATEKPQKDCPHQWRPVHPDSAMAVRSKCWLCDAISPKTVEEHSLKRTGE